ncbi:hypothetical protein [Mycobacterium riyadhense]|uniref:hypothetical protein n=1 Tax=Mycobacterium riyadhense TaxID=486698 RepID=UPI00195ED75C|nr:hypothetical protein [Mycobacterium riyadhense]
MTNPLETLAAALGGMPDMPEARCRGRHELFDPPGDGVAREDPAEVQRRTKARALCHGCPEFRRCREWLDSLPSWRRPGGIVAARDLDIEPPPPRDEKRPRRPPVVRTPRRPPTRPLVMPAPQRAKVTPWLHDHLARLGGSAPSADVKRAAAALNVSDATLTRARRALGVTVTRVGPERITIWTLPQTSPEPPQDNENPQPDRSNTA